MGANIRVLTPKAAAKLGYSRDRRKRRSEHRKNAKDLRAQWGPAEVIWWHLWQAKNLK